MFASTRWTSAVVGASLVAHAGPAVASESGWRLEAAFFGLDGARSHDLSLVPQWSALLVRISKPSARNAKGERKASHLTKEGGGAETPPLTRGAIVRLNQEINETPYQSDEVNWRRRDYWETPAEFAQRGGDCEDFAVAKYFALRALGLQAADMRIALVFDENLGARHAVLLVRFEDEVFVLDNQRNDVSHASDVQAYRPLLAVNEENWWLASSSL